jgi:hypothetical protein
VVEYGPQDQLAASRVERREDGNVAPGVLVGGEFGESQVVDAEQADVLQIRQRDTPAAPEVLVEPVCGEVAEAVARHESSR